MRLDQFLALPPEEQAVYFQEAANLKGLHPAVITKDFWVCWMLKLLFESHYGQHLVFKGGTSLSKVFGAIQRFSEDVDLAMAVEHLGVQRPDSWGSSARKRYEREGDAACEAEVRDQLGPWLEQTVATQLGPHTPSWFRFVNEGGGKSPCLFFDYPSAAAARSGLTPDVKLEFGWRTERWSVGPHGVRPWLLDHLPQSAEDWQCEVMAMEVERTFWEKATILHAEHYRPRDKALPTSMSRHYYDVAMLVSGGLAEQALANDSIREQVVEWKERLFRSSWTNYEEATPGSFRLVPSEEWMDDLRRDYETTRREMVFDADAPGFDKLMDILIGLEQRINRGE